MNGIELCGRMISVDHVKEYKIPKDYVNDENDEDDKSSSESLDEINLESKLYKPTGPDGKGWGDYRKINENDL